MTAPVSLCKHEFASSTGGNGGEVLECERCGLDWDEFVQEVNRQIERRYGPREP
jgi:hypothetical protein